MMIIIQEIIEDRANGGNHRKEVVIIVVILIISRVSARNRRNKAVDTEDLVQDQEEKELASVIIAVGLAIYLQNVQNQERNSVSHATNPATSPPTARPLATKREHASIAERKAISRRTVQSHRNQEEVSKVGNELAITAVKRDMNRESALRREVEAEADIVKEAIVEVGLIEVIVEETGVMQVVFRIGLVITAANLVMNREIVPNHKPPEPNEKWVMIKVLSLLE